MEIVYFGDNNTYIYGYCATKDDYDANEKDMRVYYKVFQSQQGNKLYFRYYFVKICLNYR